jgi:outer membrane protein assembly factor BamB
LWTVPFSAQYNNGTPIVQRDTVIVSSQGPGTAAFKVEKAGDGFKAKELWKVKTAATTFNTPVLKDGLLYGVTAGGGKGSGTFFCMSAENGDVRWNDKTKRGDCGAVLDVGDVLLALTSDKDLVVFRPSDKGFMEVAKYRVAETAPWAYPIVAGNRIFVKDQNSLTLWTVD